MGKNFVGIGIVLHKLVRGRNLILGGVHIPFHLGLEGHSDAALCVAFSPDGKLVAAGSRDGTTMLWDAVAGKTLGKKLAKSLVSTSEPSAMFAAIFRTLVPAAWAGLKTCFFTARKTINR